MSTYYTTGEFAKKAKVTIRTIRYYDKIGILKPSQVNEAGYRLYTDEDFGKLLKILCLKSLGFSLQEIGVMDIEEEKTDLKSALHTQHLLLKRKLEQYEIMEEALRHTIELLNEDGEQDWNEILKLIHLCSMERSIVDQYKDETNLNIRIVLHEKFSTNKQGWFPWIYEQLQIKEKKQVLELGCGNGKLWSYLELDKSYDSRICLTDRSAGMIQDASEHIDRLIQAMKHPPAFEYKVMDCQSISYENEQFRLRRRNRY